MISQNCGSLQHLNWHNDLGRDNYSLEKILCRTPHLQSLSIRTLNPYHFPLADPLVLPDLRTLHIYCIKNSNLNTLQLSVIHFPSLLRLFMSNICRPTGRDITLILSVAEHLTNLEFVRSIEDIQIILDICPRLSILTFHLSSPTTHAMQHQSISTICIHGFLPDSKRDKLHQILERLL